MKKFLLFLLFFASVSCQNSSSSEDSDLSEAATDLVTVQIGEIESYLEESGEISPDTIVSVTYNLTGKIMKLYKEEGDDVYFGERVAAVQPDVNQLQDINSAQIDYQRDLADFTAASNEMVEADSLYEQGLISKSSYDDIISEYEIAEAEVYSSYLELQTYLNSGDLTSTDLLYVTAPAAGTILSRSVEVGDYVLAASAYQSGTELYEIADISDMIVEAQINEIDILSIEKGMDVDITISALPDESFTGTVLRIFPEAEEVDDVKKYTVQIEPGENFPDNVMPGMSVEIEVLTVYETNILVLPLGSVIRDSDTLEDYVLVPADKKGYFRQVTVTTGERNYDYIEIEEGLEEGDEVAENPYLIDEDKILTEEGESIATEEETEDGRPPMSGGGMMPH